MYQLDKLKEGLHSIGVELKDEQIGQFMDYYELLIEWNQVMNLTSITEFDEVVLKHFIDSISLVKAIDINNHKSVIDIGTGAGFPGIPLKIAFPGLKIVLLDSLNKRVKFLNDVIEKLTLNDITAIHGRAEDFGRDKLYREQFDLCVSRAVANLSTLTEYCMPYVKPGGFFIPYKSGNIEDELETSKKAIHLLGGRLADVIKFQLPGSEIDRSFVKIEKVANTSGKYPRLSGKPSRQPIM